MKTGYGLLVALVFAATTSFADDAATLKTAEQPQEAAPAVDTVTTSSAAPGVSEAQIETKSPLSAVFFTYINSPSFEGGEGVVMNNALAPKFKFDDAGWALGANIYFDSRIGTTSKGESTATVLDMGDIAAKFYTPSFNIGSFKASPQIRYYIPVDGDFVGTAGQIQPRLYLTSTAGSFEFLGIVIPRIYLSNPKVSSGIDLFWATSYRTSKSATIDVAFNPGWRTKKGVTRFEYTLTDVGMTFTPADNLTINPYIEFNLNNPSLESTNFQTYVEWAFL